MREEEYSSKDLDHLGIVSAMCDEIDLVNTLDRLILPDPRAVLTTGECIKLMGISGSLEFQKKIKAGLERIHSYATKDLKEMTAGYFGIEVGSIDGDIP